MIFIDSNVPMYLVGRSHPLKSQAEELLEAAVTSGERLVTSAEVLQEILHRYVAIDRRATRCTWPSCSARASRAS